MKKIAGLLLWMGSSFFASGQSQYALVNSALDEQSPVISPDRATMFLTISNHPSNVGGKKDPGDIWISRWENNHWSSPVHGGSAINNAGYNAVAGVTPDANSIYLLGHYAAPTQGIAMSTRNGGSWSAPHDITIPYFLNRSSLISGHVSADGSVFIFSAESYNTKGAEDIYVTLRNADGGWEEPRNLGPVINSAFQEVSPSLSADKKLIYFSSNGRKGNGSFDIYYAERLDDSWLNWSMPINMGSSVNSDGRELYYRTFSEMGIALYTSTQNSDGLGDVRVNADTSAKHMPDSVVKMIEIRRDNGPVDKMTTIRGTITNSKTGQPVAAKVVFKSDSVRATDASKAGGYSIRIASAKVYNIVVEAPGYVGVLEKLDIHTFEMKVVEMNFKLQPIEIGATVNLKNVLFQLGTTRLLKESYDELNVVADLLHSNPKVEIELAGHTDTRGDARENSKLSQRRVDEVKKYLVSKGISGRRIAGKGYGGKRPVASSDTEENRRLNRRVEFTIIRD